MTMLLSVIAPVSLPVYRKNRPLAKPRKKIHARRKVCSILGVDLDERVPVLDMDAMDNWLRGMTNQQAAAFIAQLAQQSPILTLDASTNVGISSRPYGKRHVVRNKATDRRQNLVVTGIAKQEETSRACPMDKNAHNTIKIR